MERSRRTKYHHRGEPQIVNPESDYFYSVEFQKYFRYKVERPKGKYELPILLSIRNGERRMFHYNKLVEGISFVTKELGKKYTELVAHYYDLKDKSLKSLESELANNSALLQKESNIEDKLNVYELTSALQIQKFTFDNLEKSLRGLRTNVNALLDSYSIDKVKRVYSAIYIDGLNVSLVINLTSSRHEYRNDLMSFVSIKIPYVINYKPCELTFNVILR